PEARKLIVASKIDALNCGEAAWLCAMDPTTTSLAKSSADHCMYSLKPEVSTSVRAGIAPLNGANAVCASALPQVSSQLRALLGCGAPTGNVKPSMTDMKLPVVPGWAT